MSNGPQKVTDPIFVNPPSSGNTASDYSVPANSKKKQHAPKHSFALTLRRSFVTIFWQKNLARPLCRNVSGIFVLSILEDFPGDFLGGFFWPLFPTKMRRKNPARKSAKKSGGSKIEIREKSVLP